MLLCAGETEEQFAATCALVREVGFDRVNTAAYSPRPATPAAEWDNQVQHVDLVAHLLTPSSLTPHAVRCSALLR